MATNPATLRQIQLTKGHVAIVDETDYSEVSKYRWYAAVYPHTVYAWRNATANGKRRTQFLHRFLLGLTSPGVQADHIDGNGLNNSRSNLRICTHRQNHGNKRKQTRRHTTSRFKGVCWHRENRRWKASIKVNWKSHHLGYFDTPDEAAKAYDAAAVQYFGEFSRLNFPAGGAL